MRTVAKKDSPTAIEKTLEILVAFAEYSRELGTSEISALTGFHKATTSRILGSLLEYGLVVQNVETKKYNLGPLAYRLGVSQTSQSIQTFVNLSKLHADKLRDRLDESISLEVWTGNGTVACYLAESRKPLRVAMPPADILPPHAPAGAKAILSFIAEDQVDRILNEKFAVFTENTISSKEELLRRLVEYNRQGYAVDNEELYPGIRAIGVPIFECVSKPVAAVCAIMPSISIDQSKEARILRELKRTARIISKELKNTRPCLRWGNSDELGF